MAKISSSSLLGNLQSQSTKTLGFLRQSDVKTDNNVKKASMMNVMLDSNEDEIIEEESKISSVALMGDAEVSAQPQETDKSLYLQGFSDAMTSLTKQLESSKEGQQQRQSPGAPGGSGGGGLTETVAGGALAGGALAGGALATGGFAALSGQSGSVAYGGRENAPLSTAYSPFKSAQPIISGKGYRRNTRSNHQGYDVAAPMGEKILAYFPGVVTRANFDSGYGYYVEWKDNVYGQTHFFGHMMKPSNYGVGQKFDQGAVLGYVGSTGQSDGPHLHWEIGPQGSTIDPGQWTRSHPMKTKETEAAKVKPEVAKPTAATTQTQLQSPPKPQPVAPTQPVPPSTTPQNHGRVSSTTSTTYNVASNNSLTQSAAFLQALS